MLGIIDEKFVATGGAADFRVDAEIVLVVARVAVWAMKNHRVFSWLVLLITYV